MKKSLVLTGMMGVGKTTIGKLLAKKLLSSHKEREEHDLVIKQIIRKLDSIIPHLEFSSYPQILN